MNSLIALIELSVISILINTVGLYGISRMQSGPVTTLRQESPNAGVVGDFALFLNIVGIPFAGLVLGIIRSDLMGLGADLGNPAQLAGFTFASWIRGIGISIAVTIIVLFVIRLGDHMAGTGASHTSTYSLLRSAVYDELHWAFYRVAPIVLINDVFFGVILGVTLVLLEFACRPRYHLGSGFTLSNDNLNRLDLVLRLVCLLVSSFLFLATHNLYVMIMAHMIIGVLGFRVMHRQSQ